MDKSYPKTTYRHKNPTQKLWQDENGLPLDRERLKKECRSWDRKTWDAYLTSLEVPQREVLIEDFDGLLALGRHSNH